MPLPLGHAAIGIATHRLISGGRQKTINWQAVLLITILSNLPDVDVIVGLILRNNGSAFHRGPTHSILFSLVAGYAIYRATVWYRKTPLFGWKSCAAVIFSHILADYLFTTAPVSFFWPFEVYWSTGNAEWQQIFHAVFFDAAKDGAIVFASVILILANTLLRRFFEGGFFRSAKLSDGRTCRRYEEDALSL